MGAIYSNLIFKKIEGLPRVEGARCIACLVTNGYSQMEGINYNEVFSQVMKHGSIHLLLTMASWSNEQLDINNFSAGQARGRYIQASVRKIHFGKKKRTTI